MKRWLIFLLILPLLGCQPGQQEQQLARCVLDAETRYPDSIWRYEDERQSYVWLCMSVAGYVLNPKLSGCVKKISPSQEAPLFVECYEPRERMSYVRYWLGRALSR